jgi:hypothetical protein
MAFKKLDLHDLSKILNYSQFLKTPDDPSITLYKKEDGRYFNATRIEPVEEKDKNNHEEKIEDVKRD